MKKKGMILSFILFAALFFDQWTKYMAVIHLKSQPFFSIIKDICELVYVENTGSAWGMLSDMRVLLLFITMILLGMILYLYFRLPNEKRYIPAYILVSFLISGALGNMIDRIRLGYVIDFIYVKIIDFPVFNLADIYISVSVAFLLLIYRKEILTWMKNG